MNHTATRSVQSRLARVGRRVAAAVSECNYVQNQLTSLRNTPTRF